MRTVISAKDVDELLCKGGDPKGLPADAILTPSARDRLRELDGPVGRAVPAAHSASASAKAVTSKSPKTEIEAFFNSPSVHALKEQLCEVEECLDLCLGAFRR